MGEDEVVPRKVEKWAYGGDSIAANGHVGKKSPRNTDIGTQVSEFTGGRVQFDNYGKTSDTTGGMLGQYGTGPQKKREDRLGMMLEKDYDGIIIEVGVNDIAARGGQREEKWQKYLEKMRKNIVTMYVRAFLKGAGTGNRAEVLGSIDSAIREIEKEQEAIADALQSEKAEKRGERYASRLEATHKKLGEKKGILEDSRGAYLRHARNGRMPGTKVKRVVFVEGAPWEGCKTWSRVKGLRTLEYNAMLREVGFELNKVFGELEGPKFEVAEVHDALASEKNGMKLREEYAGQKKGGKDYLHFGNRGRKVAAAVIAAGHFPNYIENRAGVEAIARGEPPKEKEPAKKTGALARR